MSKQQVVTPLYSIDPKNDKKKRNKKEKKKWSLKKKCLIFGGSTFIVAISCFLFLFYGPWAGFRNFWITSAMTTMSHQYLATWFYNDNTINEVLANNKLVHDYYDEFMKEQDCFSLKDLKVNGNDLISLGYKGKDIGIILNNMLNKVIDEPKLNDKEFLLKHINDFIKERK